MRISCRKSFASRNSSDARGICAIVANAEVAVSSLEFGKLLVIRFHIDSEFQYTSAAAAAAADTSVQLFPFPRFIRTYFEEDFRFREGSGKNEFKLK